MIAILKESPELKAGEPPKSVVKAAGLAKIADRMLIELWMRGFAVSARRTHDKPPAKGASRSPEDHARWRKGKTEPSEQAEI